MREREDYEFMREGMDSTAPSEKTRSLIAVGELTKAAYSVLVEWAKSDHEAFKNGSMCIVQVAIRITIK